MPDTKRVISDLEDARAGGDFIDQHMRLLMRKYLLIIQNYEKDPNKAAQHLSEIVIRCLERVGSPLDPGIAEKLPEFFSELNRQTGE